MRHVVIGAGALGGTIGARLHEAGRDVVLVARGEHLQALRTRGLRLDVVIMATRSRAGAGLLDAVAEAAPDVPVACAQNGVANERLAPARFAHVLGICVMLPREHLEPGVVVAFSGPVPGVLDVGSYPGGADPQADRIAADLAAAGFSSRRIRRSCGGSTGSCSTTWATRRRRRAARPIRTSVRWGRPRTRRASGASPRPHRRRVVRCCTHGVIGPGSPSGRPPDGRRLAPWPRIR
jgi:2-dehydropantoate 2-reductase